MEMKKELAEAIVNPASYKDFEKIHAVFTELRQTAPVALPNRKALSRSGSFQNLKMCKPWKRIMKRFMPVICRPYWSIPKPIADH